MIKFMAEGDKIMAKKDKKVEYVDCTVTCACGNTFKTKSTKSEINVEICSKCHPFYTGQQKSTAARGRIEKFNKKFGLS